MPDRTPLLATQESAAFSAISRYIAQTLISIQEKHPEWIAEKYRKTPWAKPNFQSVLIGKLTKSFKVASDTASLMLTAKKYLQIWNLIISNLNLQDENSRPSSYH